MRAFGSEPIDVLLSAAAGGSGGRGSADAPGRGIYGQALFRSPEASHPAEQAGISGQPEAGPPPDAGVGTFGHIPEAAAERSGPAAQDLSVPSPRPRDREARPGLEFRHHLHSPGPRIRLSGGHPRCVQPDGDLVGAVDDAGKGLLPGSPQRGASLGEAGDLQYRPRVSVHQPRIHGASRKPGDPGLDGRPRPDLRQYLRGAVVAVGQIRRGLSSRIPDSERGPARPGRLLSLLQHPEAARSARLSNAARGSLWDSGDAAAGFRGQGLIWTGRRSPFLGQMARPFFWPDCENGVQQRKELRCH